MLIHTRFSGSAHRARGLSIKWDTPALSRDRDPRFPMPFGRIRAAPSIYLIMAIRQWSPAENARSRRQSAKFPLGDRESPFRQVFADALRIGVAYLAAKYRASCEVTRSPGSENLVMSGSYGRPLSRIQSSNHSRRNCRRVATISSYGPGWAGQARPDWGMPQGSIAQMCVGATRRTRTHRRASLCIEPHPSASAFGRMAKQPWGECSECASRCNFLSRLPRSDESRPSLYITRRLRTARNLAQHTCCHLAISLRFSSPLPPLFFRCHIIISTVAKYDRWRFTEGAFRWFSTLRGKKRGKGDAEPGCVEQKNVRPGALIVSGALASNGQISL